MKISHIEALPKIGQGMESAVYRLDSGRVCKLYHSPRLAQQEKLRRFYAALNRNAVPFALPDILENHTVEGRTLTVEKTIPGSSFLQKMPGWSPEEGQAMTARYVSALLLLRKLQCPAAPTRQWTDFLVSEIKKSFYKNRPFLPEFVDEALLGKILQRIAHIDPVPSTLLHGDFCPENVLTENGLITGVIDFGLIGQPGDYRYDLATAWRFYDMYDQLTQPYKSWFFSELLSQAKLKEKDLFAVETYIQFYSLYSVGFYSPNCSDGHSHWCLNNLQKAL